MSSGGLSIGELVGTISLDDALSGGLDKLSDVLGISEKSMGALAGAAGLLGGAVVGATSAIIAMGVHGSAIADVQDGFEGLSEAAGSSAEVMLGALQRGTLNTISNFDLMKLANTALGSGLIKSSGDMETLAAGAKLLSGRVGGDTAQAFDTLTTAVAKGKTGQLKQLGIFVDSSAAIEAYAKSVHKNVSDLSDHEKATALSRATLAALKKQLDENGPATASFSDNIDRGKVAVQNFVDNLSVAIAKSPVVAAGLDSLGQSFQAAFGGTQKDAIKTLMGYVNDFAIGLTYAGQGAVVAAQVFVFAWSAVKLAVLGVMTAVAAVGTGLVSLVAGIAQLAAEIPGAGKLVDGFAAGATDLALAMDEVTHGLAAQTGEANQALAGHSALQEKLDELNGSFVTARDVMEKARDAAVDLGAKAPTGPIRDLGDAAALTAAQIKAIEDATRKAHEALFDMKDSGAQAFQDLQDQLTLANMTGVEARLFEIQQAQEKEMAGVQGLALSYPALYEQITALIQEKYGIMSAAAQGHFQTVQQAAADAGFSTRAELESAAATAEETYQRMRVSGLFSINAVKKAHEDAKRAEAAIDGTVFLTKMQQFDLIANTAKTFISAVFGKGKIAAIATAIIDTAQAVVKALASAPPPLNYALAAAVGVAGLVQINKIRSTDIGFAEGTPGTMFQDFGRGTATTLHGPEAVVTKAQGESVAGMVADALRADRTEIVNELRRQGADAATDRRLLPYRMAQAAQLARA